jgi:putative IMPACT (imprinted ancient) family translation regulator
MRGRRRMRGRSKTRVEIPCSIFVSYLKEARRWREVQEVVSKRELFYERIIVSE